MKTKMKSVTRRLVSLILLLVMVISIIPGSIEAEASVKKAQTKAAQASGDSKKKSQNSASGDGKKKSQNSTGKNSNTKKKTPTKKKTKAKSGKSSGKKKYGKTSGKKSGKKKSGKKSVKKSSKKKSGKKSVKKSNNNSLANLIKRSKTAKKTDQILLVVGHNFSRWNKKRNGTWTRDMNCYCGYGAHGLSSNRHEGDMTTPIGSFKVEYAFGKARKPKTKLKWKKITRNSYFSSRYDKTYNTWVESRWPIRGEHLIDINEYQYALFFGFNVRPVKIGRGSAIFLHVKSPRGWKTAGCVSLTKKDMVKVLTGAKKKPYIIIVPNTKSLKKY